MFVECFITVSYHGIILLVLVILCICFQEPLTFEVHTDSIATMFGLWVSQVPRGWSGFQSL